MAIGESSRKNNSKPKVKFSVLSSKVALASAMDAVYRFHWKAAHPEESEYIFEGEISHICHFKWCVNPHHMVSETHITQPALQGHPLQQQQLQGHPLQQQQLQGHPLQKLPWPKLS